MTQLIAIERGTTRRNYTLTGRPPAHIIDALVRLGYQYDERAQQWWKQQPESSVLDAEQLAARLEGEESATTTGTLTRDEHQRRYQSYYTPESLAAELVELAGIRPGMTCLEPSAGYGVILQAVIEAGGTATAVEVDPDAHAEIEEHCDAILADFLSLKGTASYDRIVMNPPFSRDQDVRHVCHAFTFLKPGGKLVAIIGHYGLNGKTDDRRKFVDLMRLHGRIVRELPPGTFDNNARAVIVELAKPSVALSLAA